MTVKVQELNLMVGDITHTADHSQHSNNKISNPTHCSLLAILYSNTTWER
jgi:hypothetical protein